MHTTLHITGMHCASCQKLVSRALKKVPGVTEATVNLMTNKAYVEHEGTLDREKAQQEVEAVGYGINNQELGIKNINEEIHNSNLDPALVEQQATKRRMFIAWVFALPTALWMIIEMIVGPWPTMEAFSIGLILLSIPPIFYTGLPTLTAGFRALTHRVANMDTLSECSKSSGGGR